MAKKKQADLLMSAAEAIGSTLGSIVNTVQHAIAPVKKKAPAVKKSAVKKAAPKKKAPKKAPPAKKTSIKKVAKSAPAKKTLVRRKHL